MVARFLVAFLMVVVAAWPASAEPLKITDFYGIYEGEGGTQTETGQSANDRAGGVEITPTEGGFSMRWTTMQVGGAGADTASDAKVKSAEILFKDTGEGSWHGVENKMPGNGKPFSWARIKDNTLIVTVLVLRADGSYDVASYERTLVDKTTLQVRFTRFKNGDITRRAEVTLKRVEG